MSMLVSTKFYQHLMSQFVVWDINMSDMLLAYVDGRDETEKGNPNQQFMQNLFVPPSGKRKRDDSEAQYQNVGSIPQHDGANDDMPKANIEGDVFFITFVGDRKVPEEVISSSSKIPQVDGPMPDPYDEMLSTPNCHRSPFAKNQIGIPEEKLQNMIEVWNKVRFQ